MAQVTKTLTVRTIRLNPNAPRSIIFRMQAPIPNPPNIAYLTLTESGTLDYDGVIDSNDVYVNLSPGKFGPIWDWVSNPIHSQFMIVITYEDTTMRVVSIQVSSARTVVDFDGLNQTLNQLGSDVSGILQVLTQALALATQALTPPLLARSGGAPPPPPGGSAPSLTSPSSSIASASPAE